METSCIVVDIGNTSVTAGSACAGVILRIARTPTRAASRAGIRRCLKAAAGGRKPETAVLSSVVPAATGGWKAELRRLTGRQPLVVTHRLNLGIVLGYARPETIGTDRLANVCGAMSRYGAPVVVADFGTAATFDVVSAEGAFIGGIIAPGPQMMLDALADGTALLPRLELGECKRLIGRSTAEAMMSGVRHGYRGLVRELIGGLRHLVGPGARVCATGGYAEWAVAGLCIPIVADLTLYGLAEIRRLNPDE